LPSDVGRFGCVYRAANKSGGAGLKSMSKRDQHNEPISFLRFGKLRGWRTTRRKLVNDDFERRFKGKLYSQPVNDFRQK
jgi:hypothetical protein